MNFTILRYDTLDSTNTEAANQARQGADEGVCIVADEQTAGRGRQGRSWVSEKGSGLYFSIILRPKGEQRYITLIPLMAGIAVYDLLLKGFLIKPDIKWPNDILVGEKKICGILSEAVDTPLGPAVILGIGINLKYEVDNATSIQSESTFTPTRDDAADALTAQLDKIYALFNTDPQRIIDEWQQRSSFFAGKPIRVTPTVGDSFTGITDGLESNGALRVKKADGQLVIVQAGDVERLRHELIEFSPPKV